MIKKCRKFSLVLAAIFGLSVIYLSITTKTAPAKSIEEKGPAQILTTEAGNRFGIWPEKPASPSPTLLFFGGSVEEMLADEYQRQCGNLLAEKGYICVLVDAPCEGKDKRPDEPGGLDGWRYRLEQGENFVPEVNARATDVLNDLVARGYTDPEKIAACGISRGGFLAMHFAASDSRVKCTAVFAPVVNLGTLPFFKGAEKHPAVRSVDLMEGADKLVGKPLWIVLGDQDRPIDTDYVIAFARKVSRLSRQNSRIELHVMPEPGGHTTPAGSDLQSAVWIAKQFDQRVSKRQHDDGS
jgi:dienelactone hydrolase